MSYIYILPIEPIDAPVLDFLEGALFQAFQIKVKFDNRKIDASTAYDQKRNQYNSSNLLSQIIMKPPSDSVRLLGVTDADLFIPIFTFLFGEAQLDGPGAIISTQRLHNRFYGLPDNQKLLLERAKKEAIHELGHTFGLVHCFDPFCVMRLSTYVEDVDQKTAEFCNNCRSILIPKLHLLTR